MVMLLVAVVDVLPTTLNLLVRWGCADRSTDGS
jgi:hypothetical protein